MLFTLRPALRTKTADVAAIQAIYAHHVLTGTGTFELEPPDMAEIAARMDKVAARGCPWLVAVSEAGQILGYAYAGAFRERPAYDRCVEDSIYVAPDCVGQGVGRALLAALIDACQRAGKAEMLAVIGDSNNLASIGLHRSLGFTDVGVMTEVGEKFGRLLDVVILQRRLGAAKA